jgi:hypothetical protein
MAFTLTHATHVGIGAWSPLQQEMSWPLTLSEIAAVALP